MERVLLPIWNATITDNNQYDVYYDGKASTTPELTVSGSVKAGLLTANYAWKLPIHDLRRIQLYGQSVWAR